MAVLTSQKFLLCNSAIGEAPKNFLLHLLNLKCLCLKIILIPSLGFQVGPTATIERLETGQH